MKSSPHAGDKMNKEQSADDPLRGSDSCKKYA